MKHELIFTLIFSSEVERKYGANVYHIYYSNNTGSGSLPHLVKGKNSIVYLRLSEKAKFESVAKSIHDNNSNTGGKIVEEYGKTLSEAVANCVADLDM